VKEATLQVVLEPIRARVPALNEVTKSSPQLIAIHVDLFTIIHRQLVYLIGVFIPVLPTSCSQKDHRIVCVVVGPPLSPLGVCGVTSYENNASRGRGYL
jgi:hypothetical protein